jgi:CarboxypepD_reg-like domain
VTPTFMLDDASVTATAPTSADSIAAGLKAAPVVAEEAATLKPAPKAVVKMTPAATKATHAATPAVAASAAPATVEAAPAPAATPEPAAPATVTVSGKIEDENGRPLVGATVLLKGSSKGTSTDANGNYTMEVPSGDNTFIYGYGGYDDEVVRNTGSKPVNVTLTPRAKTGRKRR